MLIVVLLCRVNGMFVLSWVVRLCSWVGDRFVFYSVLYVISVVVVFVDFLFMLLVIGMFLWILSVILF